MRTEGSNHDFPNSRQRIKGMDQKMIDWKAWLRQDNSTGNLAIPKNALTPFEFPEPSRLVFTGE